MQTQQIQRALSDGKRLMQAGQLDDAASRFLAVLLAHPGHAEANYRLAGTLAKQNKKTEAIAYMERAVATDPDNAGLLVRLGQLYASTKQLREAQGAFERVLRTTATGPWAIEALLGRGIIFAETEQLDRAAEDLKRVTELDPALGRGWHNLGNVYFRTHRQDEAVDAFRKAVARNPENAMTLYSLGRALLWNGAYTESLAYLDKALERAPDQLQVLSYKILALRHGGRADEADDLEGIHDMILSMDLPPPPGFASLEEWNTALRDEIVNHPALSTDFKYRATRNGAKVDKMVAENRTAIFTAFEGQLRAGFAETLARMPRKKAHPLPLEAPAGYDINLWANVMYDGGHQAPHNHPKGWFSACYYNVLPDRVTTSGEAHEGWIEFGGSAYDFPEPEGATKRQIKPEPGLLVVFPSYIFHRTVPFSSDQIRISCAFDAKPRPRPAG